MSTGLYKILVYGCQMNIADAERMEGQLQAAGYTPTEETARADIVLINTCCVRETAEDKVYGKIGEIKKIKEKNPRLIFGITGCMAQKEGDSLMRRAPHIDFVLGTGKVHELTRIIAEIRAEHSSIVDVVLSDSEIAEDGCPLCMAATITVPIVLCPMCAAVSAAVRLRMWLRRYGVRWRRGIVR